MPLLLIIDGHAFAYRQFYAMQNSRSGASMSTRAGEPTYAVYKFSDELLRLLEKTQPEYIAVAFDRGLSGRETLYPQYKAQRAEMPAELVPQLERIEQVVRALNIPVLAAEGYEADDMIGAIVTQAEAQGVHVHIITGDRDILQLLSPLTRVQLPNFGKGGDDILMDEDAFIAKYQFKPAQLIDFKALKGDPSDNIPGVAGIGDKTATDLLMNYGTLENIYAHLSELKEGVRNKLEAGREMAFLSRQLATILRSAPIDLDLAACVAHDFEVEPVDELFAELEFRGLRKRLYSLKQISHAEPSEAVASEPSVLDYQTHLIQDELALQTLVKVLNSAKHIAFDTETTSIDPMQARLVGIALAVDERDAYYIPVGHQAEGAGTLFEQARVPQLALTQVIEALRPALSNPNIPKIAHNATYDVVVMRQHGLDVRPIYFDTMLAEWVRDPISRFLGLKNFARQELKLNMQDYEDVVGSGVKQKSIADVEVSQVAQYAGADVVVTLKAMHYLAPKLAQAAMRKLYDTLEVPLIPVIVHMEEAGALLDTAFLSEVSHALAQQLSDIEARIYALAGETFNVASPKQLSKILFETLKLPTKGLKKTSSGGYSTDIVTLDALRDSHEIIPVIIEHRELSKLKGTYVDALPSLINPKTGRVHTSYNQTGTSTGRFSSSNPNLQNIPIRTERGREIRKAFIAPAGYHLLSVDYSQIELRVMAQISGSSTLREAFLQGRDIHKATAASVFGVPIEQVTGEQRAFAKRVNFGLMYGMGAFRLARDSELTLAEADDFIKRYFERLPEVKQYLDATRQQAQQAGYVETLFGRKRYFPRLQSANLNSQEAQSELRAAINAPIQGTAADILKQAMLTLYGELQAYPRVKMILQVHDELVLEVPQEQLSEVAKLTLDIMQAVQLPNQAWTVPLVANGEYGQNWLDMQAITF